MEHGPMESSRNRYVAVVLVSTISFCCGNAIGWLSPALDVLRNETTPLNNVLSDVETSLIASSLCIGGLIGTPLFSYLSDEYGRKLSVYISSFPFMISWLIINEAKSSVGLIIARCLAGIGCTGAIIVAPAYLNEISKCPDNSKLQLLANVANNAGIFVSFVLGKFLTYSSIGWIDFAILVVFFIVMFQIPESPVHLVKMKEYKKATESIAWLMNLPINSQNVKEALNDLRSNDLNDQTQRKKNKHMIKEFLFHYTTSESFRKSFYKCFILFTIQGCTGIFAILSFTTEIFKESGGILSYSTMPLIIAAQQLVSSSVSIFLQNKLNKKTRLVGTFAISSFCLCSFGAYNYLKSTEYDLTMFRWVPLLTMCLAVVTFASGIAVIPFQILKESFSNKVHKTVNAFFVMWMWSIAFVVSLFHIHLSKAIGLYGTFWIYGTFSAIGAIFVLLFIPKKREISIETSTDLKENQENVGDILL